jgi:ABC-type lipoprotein export system ATPase subunit
MHSSVLLVSHDPLVCEQADRVLVLKNHQLEAVLPAPE